MKVFQIRGLSNCWFIQCFKEITGSSPLQYILKLRISNAQSLLENTGNSKHGWIHEFSLFQQIVS